MTRDEIIAMTRQLGICELTNKPKQDIHYSLTIHEIEDFAKLVAQHERNKFCEALRQLHDSYSLMSDSNVIREKYQYGTPLLDAMTKDSK